MVKKTLIIHTYIVIDIKYIFNYIMLASVNQKTSRICTIIKFNSFSFIIILRKFNVPTVPSLKCSFHLLKCNHFQFRVQLYIKSCHSIDINILFTFDD